VRNHGQRKLHSRRSDRDGSTSDGGAQADWVAQAEASRIEAQIRQEYGSAWLARQKAQWRDAQAAAGDKSVDELHPRHAR